jgi:hypothetical protein
MDKPPVRQRDSAVNLHLDKVRSMYAELFLLMDQATREEPGAENAGRLNKLTSELMARIEEPMAEYHRAVQSGGGPDTLGDETRTHVQEFNDQLKDGLETMQARVRARGVEIEGDLDLLKGQLKLTRKKRKGAGGYRNRSPKTRALIESEM